MLVFCNPQISGWPTIKPMSLQPNVCSVICRTNYPQGLRFMADQHGAQAAVIFML